MNKIFLSYASEDLERVRPLVSVLEEQHWQVWWDRDLVAGPSFHDKIEEALDSAGCVVVVWSTHSVGSQWVKTEANEGLERGILIPLLIDDVKPPLAFRMAQTARMLEWPRAEGELEAVKDGIRLILGQPEAGDSGSERPSSKLNHSVAVLPFRSLSGSEETHFFAAGLSEDVLEGLSQNDHARVISLSASAVFGSRDQNPALVGKQLGVSYIVEGSVRQVGQDLRITAQLTRTDNGTQIWSKSYEQGIGDGFDTQTGVALNIAYIADSKIEIDLLRQRSSLHQLGGTENPQAIAHFVSARDEYRKLLLGEGGDWQTYVRFLTNAVETDSSFRAAHELLANAYLQRHFRGRMSLKEARPAAHAALEKALAAQSHGHGVENAISGGAVLTNQIRLSLDLDYAASSSGINEHLKYRPNTGWLDLHLACIAVREGRPGEAIRRLAGATKIKVPETPLFLAFVAWIRCVCRDYEGALEASGRGLKLAVGDRDRVLILRTHAFSLHMLGQSDLAKPFIYEAWQHEKFSNPESYISLFAFIQEFDKARGILTDPRFDLVDHYQIAMGHLALGNMDGTFRSIHDGIEDHNTRLLESLLVAEWWQPVRDDPRYAQMLELLESKVVHTEQYLLDH
ncbi:MAG: TIR domain-containing protein [Proteobacteria bacterium]|nr:TIR domain-containing protein [Pseudomonadota bacterium]